MDAAKVDLCILNWSLTGLGHRGIMNSELA